MVAVVFGPFSGERRSVEPAYLQVDEASFTWNIDVRSGALRALPPLGFVASVEPRARTVPYRRPDGTLVWLGFDDADTHVVGPLLVNDPFERIYWASPSHRPRRAPVDDLLAGVTTGHDLGITPPTTPPAVTVTGGSGPEVTRAYIYVWRTAYGEESTPSPPVVVTGNADGQWDVNIPTAYVGLDCNVTHVAVYRSTPGSTAEYRFVGEVPLGTPVLTDTVSDEDLVLRDVFTEFDRSPPPTDLDWLVRHPSGALVGAHGRTVRFSLPYMPHAWPVAYTYTVDALIRALAVVGDAVVVFTDRRPFVLSGPHPAVMSVTELPRPLPVSSWRAVLRTYDGLWVASPTGLVRLQPDGSVQDVTSYLVRPEQWRSYDPADFRLTAHRGAFLLRVSSYQGFLVAVRQGRLWASTLSDSPRADEQIYDEENDRTILRYGGELYEFDADSTTAVRRGVWQSREIVLPRPVTFGWLHVDMRPLGTEAVLPTQDDWYRRYNALRFAAPLLPLGSCVLAGAPPLPPMPLPYLPPLAPLGGPPLFRLGFGSDVEGPPVVFVVADGRVIGSFAATSDRPIRLPAGFKARVWQLVVETGRFRRVVAIRIAETADDLAA